MTTTEEQPREAMAAQIEALAAKATPAPWYLRDSHWIAIQGSSRPDQKHGDAVTGHTGGISKQRGYGQDNAALILALVNNLPAIVTALRQAEAAPGVVEEAFRAAYRFSEDCPYQHGEDDAWAQYALSLTTSPPIKVERTVADGALVGVPREPTEAMKEAATNIPIDTGRFTETQLSWEEAAQVWSAMIAAAPATDEGESDA